ncbi:MAG: sensor histidine kinase [Deltaproteobacteria bacterium]|nr:sensor histidine kinase [Deltaproteobacteria bacterium]
MGGEFFLTNNGMMDAAQIADFIAGASSAEGVIENLALLEGGFLATGSDPSALFPATSSFLRNYQSGRSVDWNNLRLLIAGELRKFATNPELKQRWLMAVARLPWPRTVSKPAPQPFVRFATPEAVRAQLLAHLQVAPNGVGFSASSAETGETAAVRLGIGEGSEPMDRFSHASDRTVSERLAMARNIFDDFYALFERQEQAIRRLPKDDIESLIQIDVAFQKNFDERKKILLGLFPNPGEERFKTLVHDLKSSVEQLRTAIQLETEAGISDFREQKMTWQKAIDAIPSAQSFSEVTIFGGNSYPENFIKAELAKNFVAWIRAHHPASQSLEEGGVWLVTFSKKTAADSIEKEIALHDSPWPPDPKNDPVLKMSLSILGLTLHSVEADEIIVLRIGPFREKSEVELKKWRALAEGVDRPKAMAALGQLAVRAMVEGETAWQHLSEISGGTSEMAGPAWTLLKVWREIKQMAKITTRKELAQMVHRMLQKEHDQIIESLKENQPLKEICRRMVDFSWGVSAFVDAFEKQMEERNKEWKTDPEASAMFHDDIDNRLNYFALTGQSGLKPVAPEQRETIQMHLRDLLVRTGLMGTGPDELLRIVHQAVMQNVLAHIMGIKLQIDVPHGIILKMGDEQRSTLGTSLGELINNAIKHADGKEVTIKVSWNAKDKKITVSDDGHGIAEPEKVWEKGFREKSAGNVSGNGDGLYLVRERLRAMGGDIQVTSEIGKGSTFEISLPSDMVSVEK